MKYIFLTLLLIFDSAVAKEDEIIKGCHIDRVIDGDTFIAQCEYESFTRRIRLYCVDTPEVAQHPYSDAAYNAILRFKNVYLRIKNRDIYGRDIAEVFDRHLNINKYLVAIGAAAVWPEMCPKYNKQYYEVEKYAKKYNNGIWAEPGLHQTPWEYRRSKKR